jgi:hypothetical protein
VVRAEDEPRCGGGLEALLDAKEERDERRFRPVEESGREPVMPANDSLPPTGSAPETADTVGVRPRLSPRTEACHCRGEGERAKR